MKPVMEAAIRLALQYAAQYLRAATPSQWDEAIKIITFEVTNMLLDAIEGGSYGGISTDIRARYEGRMAEALRQLGVLKEF